MAWHSSRQGLAQDLSRKRHRLGLSTPRFVAPSCLKSGFGTPGFLNAWLFDAWVVDAWLFDAWCFYAAWLSNAWLFDALLFDALRFDAFCCCLAL